MQNSKTSFANQPLRLEIRGFGHPPSFKNSKSIYRRRDGKPFIATGKKGKAWMAQATASIASQLQSAALTACGATSTEEQRRYWIALSMPLDDCRQIIREIIIKTEDVEPGQEGADIVIEKLP